jgi:exopolysaccharide biosynthesis WecB/TagA/CpsF family protein
MNLFGINYFNCTTEEVIDAIIQKIESRKYSYVVTPNSDHIVNLSNDSKLKEIYEKSSIIINDSRVISFLVKLKGKSLRTVTGSDLTKKIILSEKFSDYVIAVIGPSSKEIEIVNNKYNVKLKHIDCCEVIIREENSWSDAIENVNQTEWDILLVCLSHPKQEMFSYDLRKKISNGIALNVGASIDFLTGKQKRAPRIYQLTYTEWLYRLLADPKKMWKRYLINSPKIITLILKEK